MLRLMLSKTSSIEGTGQVSGMVRSFRFLKSTTGLYDPSALGTSSKGELHSLVDFSIMPPATIDAISSLRALRRECGILNARNLMGTALLTKDILWTNLFVLPIGLSLDGKTIGKS